MYTLGAAFLSFEVLYMRMSYPNGVVSVFKCGAANDFAIGYCSFAILFIAIHFYMHGNEVKSRI